MTFVPTKTAFYGSTTAELESCLADLERMDDRDEFLDRCVDAIRDEITYRHAHQEEVW